MTRAQVSFLMVTGVALLSVAVGRWCGGPTGAALGACLSVGAGMFFIIGTET